MIDIHCHIIPGVDDGPVDINTTMNMIKIAGDSGTEIIVATPHYYPGYYHNKFDGVVKAAEFLNSRLEALNIKIKILPGQEILLDKNTVNLYTQGIIGGINSTKYMLVELPMDGEPKEALETLYELRIRGIVPILAHPERYPFVMKDVTAINSYIEEGCLFQLNAGSLMEHFGKEVRQTCEMLIKHNLYSFIASDAHSDRRRNPDLRGALNKLSGHDSELQRYFNSNSEMLLNNGEIKTKAVKLSNKRSFFSIFKH